MRALATIGLACAITTAAFGQAREPRRTGPQQPTGEVILKWRAQTTAAASTKSTRLQKLTSSTGLRLQHKGQLTADTEVLRLEQPLAGAALQAALASLSSDPAVEYVAPNERKWAHALTTDPLLSEQWYLLGAQASGTHTDLAWDTTQGTGTTVVAVLDTGVRFEHPDLGRVEQGGKLLAGYDFISNTAVANDGNLQDPDPADPGDWMTAAEAQQPPFAGGDCLPDGRTHINSSWHGTRVSSLIAAMTDNAVGMAGSGWNTQILPVRVLGKCGGYDSDIIAGMRWAAGLSVADVPNNPRPANIINLSLGSQGACSAAYQAAVNEITAQGVLIVASVGNDGTEVSSPANCNGVLGVTGLRHAGTKVGFSNLGAHADIGAPGGNCVNTAPEASCLYYILTATNEGLMEPTTDLYTTSRDGSTTGGVASERSHSVGTSFSAPLVSGAAALMYAVNSRLSPAQFTTLLQETAAPFPTSSETTSAVCAVPTSTTAAQIVECICTTQTCGAGMLNTRDAVLAAQRPFAIAQAPRSITVGTSVTIDARTSIVANNRNVASYQWTALNVTGATPALADATQALTTLQVGGSSQFTLRLTVTDDQGAQDTADVAIATPVAPSTPPAAAPRSGGGGGSMDWSLLLGVMVLRAMRSQSKGFAAIEIPLRLGGTDRRTSRRPR